VDAEPFSGSKVYSFTSDAKVNHSSAGFARPGKKFKKSKILILILIFKS
jgi:hypothetical protein